MARIKIEFPENINSQTYHTCADNRYQLWQSLGNDALCWYYS